MDQPPPLNPLAGAWRRIGAFFIDCVALALVGATIGNLAFDYFASLGGWARLYGLGIALVYFTATIGPPGSGQTLGQRLLKIRVVDGNGRLPGFKSALIRALVLCVPYILNGIRLRTDFLTSTPGAWLINLVLSVVLTAGAVDVYLFLFNRPSHRCLHDMASGTFVVGAGSSSAPSAPPVWRGHWMILALIGFVLVGTGSTAKMYLNRGLFGNLLAAQRRIESIPSVRYAFVSEGRTWQMNPSVSGIISTYSIMVDWRTPPGDYEAAANRVAQALFQADPQAMNRDIVTVTVSYGYDIGIASLWKSVHFSHPPRDWPRPKWVNI